MDYLVKLRLVSILLDVTIDIHVGCRRIIDSYSNSLLATDVHTEGTVVPSVGVARESVGMVS